MDWDKIKESAKKVADKTKELANDANETRIKSNQETKLKFKNKVMGQTRTTTVRKDTEGLYYLSSIYSEDADRYTFENLEFGGSTIIQKTTGSTSTQGRAGSALVGGMLAGPVGSIVGGARKRKGKIDTTTTNEEKEGKGVLHLRNAETNEVKSIKFLATASDLSNMERFFK